MNAIFINLSVDGGGAEECGWRSNEMALKFSSVVLKF